MRSLFDQILRFWLLSQSFMCCRVNFHKWHVMATPRHFWKRDMKTFNQKITADSRLIKNIFDNFGFFTTTVMKTCQKYTKNDMEKLKYDKHNVAFDWMLRHWCNISLSIDRSFDRKYFDDVIAMYHFDFNIFSHIKITFSQSTTATSRYGHHSSFSVSSTVIMPRGKNWTIVEN